MGSVFDCIGMEVKVAQTSKQWYVVNAFSGMEKTVLKNLEERIKQAGMAESFWQNTCARRRGGGN